MEQPIGHIRVIQKSLLVFLFLIVTLPLLASTVVYATPGIFVTHSESDLGNGFWQYDFIIYNISNTGESLYDVLFPLPQEMSYQSPSYPQGWNILTDNPDTTTSLEVYSNSADYDMPAGYLGQFSIALDSQLSYLSYEKASFNDSVANYTFDCITVPDNDIDGYGDYSNVSNSASYYCLRSRPADCNDNDFLTNPGAYEGPKGDTTCSDGIDNDCDGTTDAGDSGCLTLFFINSNEAYTKSARVTLSHYCEGNCTKMKFSNDNITYSTSIPYASSSSWKLTSTNGKKTVYVKYRVNGKWSKAYRDTIILDTKPPINGALTAVAGNGQAALSWSGFTDKGIKIAFYKVVYDTITSPASCSTGTNIYAGTGASFLHQNLTNGSRYYYRVCAMDGFGFTSTGVTANARPAP